MTGIEPAVVAIGKSLAVKAGKIWLAAGISQADRSKDLTDLIRVRFVDNISRRRAKRQIDDIADSVAERLLPLCRQEFRNLSNNDKESVIAEVKASLTESDLSDRALFAADADPIKLSATLRERMPRRRAQFELGDAGAEFYEILLDECCDCLIRIVLQLPQFGARATQDILIRLSSLAANVDVALARLPVRSLDAPQGREDDAEFRRRYLEHISSTLDYSELFGINFERYRPLTTLSVSYISLSVSAGQSNYFGGRPTADQNFGASDWREDQATRESATIRVEAALSESERLMIRGEAGSGKSTLLRWLAVTAARGRFTVELEKWNGRIPFLVKLRSHAEHGLPSPEEFLIGIADPIRGLMPPGWVHRQMSSGKVLLLVDGVDELAGTQRRAVRPWMANLLTTYPHIQVVVTSRPAAASADWLAAEGFGAAFLERMSPADIRALIRHWHLAARDAGGLPCEPDELPSYESSLLARLELAPHLRALAGTPLLAAMLCALNLDRVRQLPRDRMSLYAAALDMLLNRRDIERGIPSYHDISLETSQKVQILQGLAWRLSTTNRSELPKATVIQCVGQTIDTMPRASGLEAEGVVSYLLQRSGVLREPVKGRIDFVHRTIQEYLTAKQLADEGDMDLLIRSAHKYQWHDTVIMAAGHANFPLRQELVAGLLTRIQREPKNARILKLLVASCLETLNSLPEDLTRGIDRCLDDLIPPNNLWAARSLATVGESVIARLPHSIDSLPAGAACATIQTASLINGPEALEVLQRYRTDTRKAVQSQLMAGWQYFEPLEYAKKVLADAPLLDGVAVIESVHCLPALKALNNLRAVQIRLSGLRELTLLSDVPKLSALYIAYLSAHSLEPLIVHNASLRNLTFVENRYIQDYSPLSRLDNLQLLRLGTGPKDLNFLRDMRKLTNLSLQIYDATSVSDYSPLSNLNELRTLELWQVRNLRDLEGLPFSEKLTRLFINGIPKADTPMITDGLEYIVRKSPNLRSLNLDFFPWISDVTSISQLCRLTHLRLWGCVNVHDITPLAMSGDLDFLDIEGTSVSDISCLSRLTGLKTLWLKGCAEINDLSPLANCKELKELFIQDISPDIDLSPLKENHRVRVYIHPGQRVRAGDWLGRRLILR